MESTLQANGDCNAFLHNSQVTILHSRQYSPSACSIHVESNQIITARYEYSTHYPDRRTNNHESTVYDVSTQCLTLVLEPRRPDDHGPLQHLRVVRTKSQHNGASLR